MNDTIRTTGIPVPRLHDWRPGNLLNASDLDPPNRAIESMLGAQSVAQEVLYPPISSGGALPVLVKPDNTAIFGDYFEAQILNANGGRTSTRVSVAKPFDLRRTPFHGATIEWQTDFQVRYEYFSNSTIRKATRLAHGDIEERFFLETVWKPYGAIEYISGGPTNFTYPLWALQVGEAITGVDGADWLDLNVDARIWVER